jgi:hypothetical protein
VLGLLKKKKRVKEELLGHVLLLQKTLRQLPSGFLLKQLVAALQKASIQFFHRSFSSWCR